MTLVVVQFNTISVKDAGGGALKSPPPPFPRVVLASPNVPGPPSLDWAAVNLHRSIWRYKLETACPSVPEYFRGTTRSNPARHPF